MIILVIAIIVGAFIGWGMAINGRNKRRDRRDANRFLAEQHRAKRKSS